MPKLPNTRWGFTDPTALSPLPLVLASALGDRCSFKVGILIELTAPMLPWACQGSTGRAELGKLICGGT